MNEDDKDKNQRLTIEEFKKCEGCQHYTDEEAEEIIDTLEQLTIVLFKLYQKDQNEGKG